MSSRQEMITGNDLSNGLAVYRKADTSYHIVREILHWTDGQPVLFDLVCELVLEYPSTFAQGQENVIIREVVQAKIIKDWPNNTASAHLQSVVGPILSSDRCDALLALYRRVLEGDAIASDRSQEQRLLLESGLLKVEEGELKVSNATYASVFDQRWVDHHLLDRNQPVVANVPTTEGGRTRTSTRLWSGIALLMFLVGVAAYPLLQRSKEAATASLGSRQTATQRPLTNPDVPPPTPEEPVSQSALNSQRSDRELFDSGIDHGKSGRWLPMLRDFCQVAETSSYFTLAETQLTQWHELFGEDIQLALVTFVDEEEGTCPVAEDVVPLRAQ